MIQIEIPIATSGESPTPSEVRLEGLTVTRGRTGLILRGRPHVTIRDVEITGNARTGLFLADAARATLQAAQITGNGGVGLALTGSAQATVEDSRIVANGADGVLLLDASRATLRANTIQDNKGCGVAALSPQGAQGEGNRMGGNLTDLCGNLPAGLRLPLVAETEATELRFPGPYPTLQATIDALAPGGTILLAEGEHPGGVTIGKPLTLRGAGADRTTIRGIVSLVSEAQGVQLEGLAITGSPTQGVLLGGQAQATLQGVAITGNGSGLELWGASRVALQEVRIADNGPASGLAMIGSSRATLVRSLVVGNRGDGLLVTEMAQLLLKASSVAGNGRGVGLGLSGASQATVEDSHIDGNGTDPECRGPLLCSGIALRDQARLTLRASTVRANTDWGVEAWLRACGHEEDAFTGEVTFEAMELGDISDNNTTGDQDGKGNPGDHPWNRPEVSDGQVCLP